MFKPTKITTFFLIALLLVASVGNLFGVVACESGCSSAVHQQNHAADAHHPDVNASVQISFQRQLLGSGDSCRDYLIQLRDGFFKEGATVKSPKNSVIAAPSVAPLDPANFYLPVSHAYLKSPLIIAKTMLALRTVVLLH